MHACINIMHCTISAPPTVHQLEFLCTSSIDPCMSMHMAESEGKSRVRKRKDASKSKDVNDGIKSSVVDDDSPDSLITGSKT